MRIRSNLAVAIAVAASMLGFQTESARAQPRHNSRLALAAQEGRLLITANADSGTVSVVDREKRLKLGEISVGRVPEGVAALGSKLLAAATVYDDDQVVLMDLDRRVVARRIAVPDEPYGVVATRDGRFLYVTHDYPGLVTEIDVDQGVVARRWDVGPFARGIAITADDARLYVVQYYSGSLVAIDRGSGEIVDRWTGASSDNLARQIVLHPRHPLAYIPHIRSRVDRQQGTGSISPFLTLVDIKPQAGSARRRTPFALDSYNGIGVPADPTDVALSPDGETHFVIYAGTDDMNVSEAKDDYPYLKRRGGFVRLGRHPRGIVVSPDGQEVYVLNAYDFNIWVMDAKTLRKLAEIPISANSESEAILLGKRLFHSANQPMSSRRWISCASCHPAGGQDARVWSFPDGNRNTTGLFGMSRTLPLHWSADRDELHDFEHTIRGPLMQGRGLVRGPIPKDLGELLAGRSPELDALAEYCLSLRPTISPHAAGPNRLSAAAERGRLVFESRETQCAQCHPAPYYTDSSVKAKPFPVHDVGTGQGDDTEKQGPSYDAPSLIGVYKSAPYLHDGRAAALRDVLTVANPQDKHGKTSHLTSEQIDDLTEFLKSLPYLEESIQ